jgi:tellurite methyltransferase
MHVGSTSQDFIDLAPTKLVQRFGTQMVAAAAGRPILDVACGNGRNAVFIAHLGGNVICIDQDLSRLKAKRICLKETLFARALPRVGPLKLDLIRDEWPFPPQSVGGILNIHFLHTPLLSFFASSTATGRCLLLETIQARGENYQELPSCPWCN